MAPRTRARLAIIAAAILLLAGAGWLVLGRTEGGATLGRAVAGEARSEEHTSELQSH